AFWLGLFLLHQPSLLEILPMYCFFLALTPLLLWELRIGNVRWVLGGSVVLGLISGLVIQLPVDPDGICFGAFNPLSYQILFIFGLAFGTGAISVDCRRPKMEWLLVVLSSFIAAFFFLLRLVYAINPIIVSLIQQYHWWFSVTQHG